MVFGFGEKKESTSEKVLRELREISNYFRTIEDPTNPPQKRDEVSIPSSVQRTKQICEEIIPLTEGGYAERGRFIEPEVRISTKVWKDLEIECETFLTNRVNGNPEQIKQLWVKLRNSIIRRISDLEGCIDTKANHSQAMPGGGNCGGNCSGGNCSGGFI